MIAEQPITFRINGEQVTATVEPRMHLADCIRQLGFTATHLGCEHGVCGACTLVLNGKIVRGCLTLAVQADGAEVSTAEGLDDCPVMERLREAFVARNAAQCGYCTPAMLVTARSLLLVSPQPSRDRVRDYLSGNLCRCTGYQAIVEAVLQAAAALRGEAA